MFNRQATEWKNIFPIFKSDKGIITGILDNKFLQVDNLKKVRTYYKSKAQEKEIHMKEK